MKIIKPKEETVRVKAYFNKHRNTYRVEASSYDVMKKRKNSISFTLYDTDIDEVKDVLIKAFEEHTGEQFPVEMRRKIVQD